MSDIFDSTWNPAMRVGFIVNGKKKFYLLREAIAVFDSGWVRVEDPNEVLELDFSVRQMTAEESSAFQSRVDEYSASK